MSNLGTGRKNNRFSGCNVSTLNYYEVVRDNNTQHNNAMKTTLNQIRSHSPCIDGWKKLLSNLNKTAPDDEPLTLLTILDSNGLDHALWCLRAVEGHEKEKMLLSVKFARRVQHLMGPRSIAALDVAERYAKGEASYEEVTSARDEAWAAYTAAYNAAYVTAAALNADVAAFAARAAACAAWNEVRSAAVNASFDTTAEREAQAAILREMLANA